MMLLLCMFVLLTAKSVTACYSGELQAAPPEDPPAADSSKDLACKILSHSRVTLLTINPSGVNDGADAKSNIRDTCNGGSAKRSSYCCDEGCAPDGYVDLKKSVLQYILDLADDGYNIQVNSLAGACHSTNSWHYQGTAVDFQKRSGDPYQTWMNYCSNRGAVENLGPGSPGHSRHTHCAFSS